MHLDIGDIKEEVDSFYKINYNSQIISNNRPYFNREAVKFIEKHKGSICATLTIKFPDESLKVVDIKELDKIETLKDVHTNLNLIITSKIFKENLISYLNNFNKNNVKIKLFYLILFFVENQRFICYKIQNNKKGGNICHDIKNIYYYFV